MSGVRDTELIGVVLRDRTSAVSLMEHLSRYGSFLVEPDAERWLVFAHYGDQYARHELLGQIEAWASAHNRPGPSVHDGARSTFNSSRMAR